MRSEESGRPWSVGVADPRAPSRPALELHVPRGGGVATSGTYERGVTRGGVRYHHLLDARTGWPAVTGVASATAITGTALRAGQFSTAAVLLSADEGFALLEKTKGIEGVILTEDGAVLATSGARQERSTA